MIARRPIREAANPKLRVWEGLFVICGLLVSLAFGYAVTWFVFDWLIHAHK